MDFMLEKERPKQIIQPVKVGDRFANMYSGVGNSFHVGDEIIKSRRLGKAHLGPTFEVAYFKWTKVESSVILKITPDGVVETVRRSKDGFAFDKVTLAGESATEEQLREFKLMIPLSADFASIVVIPNYSYQPSEMITALPEMQLDRQFDRAKALALAGVSA